MTEREHGHGMAIGVPVETKTTSAGTEVLVRITATTPEAAEGFRRALETVVGVPVHAIKPAKGKTFYPGMWNSPWEPKSDKRPKIIATQDPSRN